MKPVAPPSPTWSGFRSEDEQDVEGAAITEEHPTQRGYPPFSDVLEERNISAARVSSAGTHSTRLTGSWHVENLVQKLAAELPDVTGDLIMEMVDKKLQDEYTEALATAKTIAKTLQFRYDLPGAFEYQVSCIRREPSSLAFARFFGAVFKCMDLKIKPVGKDGYSTIPRLAVQKRRREERARLAAKAKFASKIRPALLCQFAKPIKVKARKYRMSKQKRRVPKRKPNHDIKYRLT